LLFQALLTLAHRCALSDVCARLLRRELDSRPLSKDADAYNEDEPFLFSMGGLALNPCTPHIPLTTALKPPVWREWLTAALKPPVRCATALFAGEALELKREAADDVKVLTKLREPENATMVLEFSDAVIKSLEASPSLTIACSHCVECCCGAIPV
jgi:hypothetical protein